MGKENPKFGNEDELVKPVAEIIDGQEFLLSPGEIDAIKKMRGEDSHWWREQR